MEGSDSSRSRDKRDADDDVDARSSWKEDDEHEDVEDRKNRSGKSTRYIYDDEGDEDDYDVRRESRVSKVPRRSPEERSERRLSDGYKDRDGDSSRRRREDNNDWDSSRRSGSRTSGHDVSRSKSRSSDRTSSDRADTRDSRSSADQSKNRSAREAHDYRNELSERWEDTERRKGSARTDKNDQDRRSIDPRYDSPPARDDRIVDSVDNTRQNTLHYNAKSEESDEKCMDQVEGTNRISDNVETKDMLPYVDKDGHALSRDGRNKEARHHREKDDGDQGHSDSDNERNISMKEKIRVDAHGDYKSYRGRDRNRELEGSKEHWGSRQRHDLKEPNDYDVGAEWRHGQERLDGGNFHGRSGYRKDSRGRYESSKGPSSYGNRYDSSDSIEIRPNRNLDFGRESSVSGRRINMGSLQDLTPGTSDPSEENKRNYGNGEDAQERYYDDVQNMDGKIPSDSQTGRGGAIASNNSGAGPSGSGSIISPTPQQGPKGSRPSRGLRGRPNVRDPQRMGLPVPLMPPPPFGPLGLPPGPMQPIGPNMSHSPGPLGPGVFIPPFPGHLVWPGARGIDVNMLSVPTNLPIPPVAGPSFTSSVAAGPNHSIHLNQTGSGLGSPANAPGTGFNPLSTPNHEILQDKPPAGWTPQWGPAGKAPSRGEQNDYSQNFVDTGMRPQNFIRELELTSVVEDYPKLRELIQRKDDIVSNSASAPMYYKCDLKDHMLSPEFFGTKFDVILIDPPWEEYVHRAPGITDHIEYWTPDEIMNLKIEAIADTPSFIFLWVGDGVGLEQGRQCLKKWGFRRCEDICWIKTNKKNATPGLRHDSNTLFQHSKEHCLMGIKGTVRRSTDGHIIHANIDTDIIIAEEPTDGSTKKPEDMYRIIEHFALGRRRLELFGEDHNIRPGWLTLGKGLSSSNFHKEAYIKNFMDRDGKIWQGGGGRNPPPDAPHLVVTTPEIESLRPKSPPQKSQQQQSMPPMGSSSSTNRRSVMNSSQIVVTVVGSETMMPSPWSSNPMSGFGMPE
uniref:Methyltransferase-like protein 1 n=1 Tax=Oryza nivara TaxID=4536 RepID=A0A0E0ISQ5_ORYNI